MIVEGVDLQSVVGTLVSAHDGYVNPPHLRQNINIPSLFLRRSVRGVRPVQGQAAHLRRDIL